MLRKETGQTIGDWLFEDVLCRWGGLTEIVSDNGAPLIKAIDYLAKKYCMHHICISGYNSRANGLIERPHFNVRQALFKSVDGDQLNGIRVPTPSFGQIESLFDVVWVVCPISQSLGHILFFLSTSRKHLPSSTTKCAFIDDRPYRNPSYCLTKMPISPYRSPFLRYGHPPQAAICFERDHMATI